VWLDLRCGLEFHRALGRAAMFDACETLAIAGQFLRRARLGTPLGAW
jgi:hypothetical protein